MNFFFTADLHFGHKGILKHTDRPWKSCEEMDQALIDNWNNIVPPKKSFIYVIGDFAWKDHEKYLQRLNGHITLITGSHDRMSKVKLASFHNVFEGSKMISLQTNDNRSLKFFADHCCHRVWEKGHYGLPHIFGHSHGRLKTFNMSVDVGVDNKKLCDYEPIPLDILLTEFQLREMEMEMDGRIIEENGKRIYRQDDVSFIFNKLQKLQSEV